MHSVNVNIGAVKLAETPNPLFFIFSIDFFGV